MQLAELIDSNSGGWNRRVIEETFVLIDAQKIKVMFGFGENKGDKKLKKKNKMENDIFNCLVEESKQGKQKNKKENFPSGPIFFYLLNLRGK